MNDKKRSASLKKTEVFPHRYYQTNVTYNTNLVWRISNYENLSHNVIYCQAYEDVRRMCVLRLFKQNNLLHLALSSPSIFKDMLAEFSIINPINQELITEKAHQICDGIYVGKFSEEQFLSSSTNYLSEGTLTIAFKYVSGYFTLYNSAELGAPEELSSCDELCFDFKTMYLEALYPDFFIHVNEYTFKCHKLILVTRSELLAEFLYQNKTETEYRMPKDVLPGIMHQVLLYMYCGELMEMNMKCMLHVYKMAKFLKIRALNKRCSEYIETAIDYDNHREACDFAVKNDLKDLKNDIIRTFNKTFPDYDIMSVFEQFQTGGRQEKIGGDIEKVLEKN